MSHPAHRSMAALCLAAALAISGCAPDGEPGSSASPTPVPSSDASASSSATPEPAIDPSDVTCDDLVPADVREVFASSGWTLREDPFLVGSERLEDGLICSWGDFSGAGGDSLQFYGWSPLSANASAALIGELVDQGWIREDSERGVYVTENPDNLVTGGDDEGYGMTYLFGDGWVTVADTKQSLLVITRPGG